MSSQMADYLVNNETGKVVVPVFGGSDELVLAVKPSSGTHRVVVVDQYAFQYFAYYKLDVTKPAGVKFTATPVTTDGSVGCQARPEFPITAPSRVNWSEQDNDDNADGKAFRSFVLEFEAPPTGIGFACQLKRWVKFYTSVLDPMGYGGGKRDYSRPLNLRVMPQSEETFDKYIQSHLNSHWAIKSTP